MAVKVMVSKDFVSFRESQGRLNDFLWSTELCYQHVLKTKKLRECPNSRVDDINWNITPEAWFPSAKGTKKYQHRVSEFLAHVQGDISYIYSAVIILFSAAFEGYLESKRSQIDPRKLNGQPNEGAWGPYCHSMCGPSVYWENQGSQPQRPVRLRTVLTADMCRLLRNSIAHQPNVWPKTATDDLAVKWTAGLSSNLKSAKWYPVTKLRDSLEWESLLEGVLKKTIQSFVGGAAHKAKHAGQKNLPIEFFYMLFTLTTLDSLAFEIEEALLPPRKPADADHFVFRDIKDIRRVDLIFQ